MTGSARRSRVALTAAAVLTLSAGLLSASADAAFPGSNGRIAFERFGTSATPILTMKANGTDKRRLTRNPPSAVAPAYSPDGRSIVFVGFPDNADGEIFTMRTDGTHAHQLTHNTFDDGAPTYAPNGRRIAFEAIVPPATSRSS